jgi:threonine/homoserine/homoserine lactone efflux protein
VAAGGNRESDVRLFIGGLALTLGNPKVVAFYLALLPNSSTSRASGSPATSSLRAYRSSRSRWRSAPM